MGLFKYSGGSHIRKQKTTAEVFANAGGASGASILQIYENAANIIQLSKDLYITPSLDGDAVANLFSPVEALVPIGTIKPFYDYGTEGPGGSPLTFDTNTWAYCDGSVISDVNSPLNGKTLPDLSERYLVGFGTDGGNDIDTAAWPAGPSSADWTAVGNAAHQVDISHTHGPGTYQFVTNNLTPSVSFKDAAGLTIASIAAAGSTYVTGGAGPAPAFFSIGPGSGDAYTRPTGSLGVSASGGSSTQSIQPRSIRVRYIMRIK